MESGIPDLVRLLGRPSHTPDAIPVDSTLWNGAEYRLRLSFPSDYKELIALFGVHAWGDFLHCLNPATKNEYLHLERAALRLLGGLHEIRREYPNELPYALYPENGGLFPWGVTDNGDTLLWLTNGPPNWWPTVILAARDPGHERHQLTATALLAAFMSGDLQSPMLVGPFGGDKPVTLDPGWNS